MLTSGDLLLLEVMTDTLADEDKVELSVVDVRQMCLELRLSRDMATLVPARNVSLANEVAILRRNHAHLCQAVLRARA